MRVKKNNSKSLLCNDNFIILNFQGLNLPLKISHYQTENILNKWHYVLNTSATKQHKFIDFTAIHSCKIITFPLVNTLKEMPSVNI